MEVKVKVLDLKITHDDIVELISGIGGASYMTAIIPAEFNNETYTRAECFEDKIADILFAGKYIYLVDIEAGVTNIFDHVANNSLVLKYEKLDEFEGFIENFYAPLYRIDLKRIRTALTQILDGNMTGKYQDCVKRSLRAMIDETADAFDYENIAQYIMFGDAIYG